MDNNNAQRLIQALNNLSAQIGMLIDVLIDKERDKMQEFEDMAERVPFDEIIEVGEGTE